MTLKITVGAILLVAATALVTTQAVSQEQPSPEEMQQAMEKWMEPGLPGEQHASLMKRAGKWTTFVNDDEFVVSIYDLVISDDAKVMEITDKRAK